LGPAIEKFGIAENATLDGDNLAERLKLELAEESAVAISPSLIGAWSKLPAAEI
jgi:hypothetical protein